MAADFTRVRSGEVLTGVVYGTICADRSSDLHVLCTADAGYFCAPSNRSEKPAFESRRDPPLDLCGDALIDALLTKAW